MNFAIFEEVVYNFCRSDNGLMPNFIKKSWTVSQGDVICFSDRNSCCNVNNIFEKVQICIFHELELLFECGENSIWWKLEYSFRNNFIPLECTTIFFCNQSLKCFQCQTYKYLTQMQVLFSQSFNFASFIFPCKRFWGIQRAYYLWRWMGYFYASAVSRCIYETSIVHQFKMKDYLVKMEVHRNHCLFSKMNIKRSHVFGHTLIPLAWFCLFFDQVSKYPFSLST